MLLEALERGKPDIFNTDQVSQYTSVEFTKILEVAGIQISMDGRGRALDNVWIERLWRTVKQEGVYIRDYVNGIDAYRGLAEYFRFYNEDRPHSSLDWRVRNPCNPFYISVSGSLPSPFLTKFLF